MVLSSWNPVLVHESQAEYLLATQCPAKPSHLAKLRRLTEMHNDQIKHRLRDCIMVSAHPSDKQVAMWLVTAFCVIPR